MNNVYSPKQLALMRLWQGNKLKRINLLEGSVRSGKTWISLVLWAFWVATSPEVGNYLMVAKTLTSLRRNCLDLLQSLVGSKNFNYSLSKKEGRLFGRLIYLEGVNDARAESKIAEFGAYRWDEKSTEDKPIKENDHAMDGIRYFVNTVIGKGPGVVRLGR